MVYTFKFHQEWLWPLTAIQKLCQHFLTAVTVCLIRNIEPWEHQTLKAFNSGNIGLWEKSNFRNTELWDYWAPGTRIRVSFLETSNAGKNEPCTHRQPLNTKMGNMELWEQWTPNTLDRPHLTYTMRILLFKVYVIFKAKRSNGRSKFWGEYCL